MLQVNDALLQAIERLEQAVAREPSGDGRAWANRMDRALGEAEQALRQEQAEANLPKGLFKAVDMTRPALVRRVGQLRRALGQDVGEAVQLRNELQAATQGAPPDLDTLRQHVRDFVADLRRIKEGEIDVVQESVTTDLGAGD
jgi:hypothetical protein